MYRFVAALASSSCIGLFAISIASPAQAEQPGRGQTAKFEVEYLKMIADHHLSALRMTELAAGTDATRDPTISPQEGTSPSPDMSPVQAKAVADEVKSLARRNNRMQREEILTALSWLRDWYGISYRPHIDRMGRAQITLLEQAPAGAEFDHLFMEVLSRHHFMALAPSATCQVAADPEHHALQRYCSNIVHAQISDIQDMREMLCREFSVCDYQPLVGLKGRHSGDEGQSHLSEPASE